MITKVINVINLTFPASEMWEIARESNICAREYRKREKTQGFAVIIGKIVRYPILLQCIKCKNTLLSKQSVSLKGALMPTYPLTGIIVYRG